jgi:hypothetical protein
VTDIEGRALELHDRVGNLMIVIVDNVTTGHEDISTTTITKAAKEIERDIDSLMMLVVILLG